MKRKTSKNKLLKVVAIIFLIFIVHHFVIRPWILDWGSSPEIQKVNLSGDNLSTGKVHTRAILIQASPEKIWPWIVQLGQERGGFYSYTWLENLVLADMHNVYELRKELQLARMPGDTIWLATKKRYKGIGYQIIARVIPDKAFVMVSGEDYQRIKTGQKVGGSWSLYLHPEGPELTWLIARSCGGDQSESDRVLRYIFYEVPHFIMEQKMLRTIKNLSEE